MFLYYPLKLLPEYLKEAGYSTHLVGKWHLGFGHNGTLPLERGFDSFYGILGAEFHPFLHSMGRPMLYDGENLVDQSGDYATYLFSDRAAEIVKRSSDQPKFIYLSYTAPHSPHAAPEDLKNTVRKELFSQKEIQKTKAIHRITEEFVTYQAMIRAMDIGVKQIYEAAQQQTDRETIIVFTSDNGAATRFTIWKPKPLFVYGRKDENVSATGCNYPLKGKKSSLNEAGF